MVPLIGWIGYSTYKLLAKYLEKPQPRIKKELEDVHELFVKKYACPGCHTNVRSIISKECGHLSHCKGCWRESGLKCAECEREYRAFTEVYVT